MAHIDPRYPSSALLPVLPFFKLNSRKTGTLIINGLLGNLGQRVHNN